MNGARTIFRRKGYLFTALAAAVLLAASSGTAWAQDSTTGTITIDSVTLSPTTVAEGDTAIATVKFTVRNTTSVTTEPSIAADEVRVGLAFALAATDSSARYTNATVADFTGLTAGM